MRRLVTEIDRQEFFYKEIDPLQRRTSRLFTVFIICVALWGIILSISILAFRDANYWLCGFSFVLSFVFACVSIWCVIQYQKFAARIERKYDTLKPR